MYNFNVKQITNECINWIKTFFENNGKDCNAVLGISGGKDSSVCAVLCKEAIGANRVLGVLMPSGIQPDIEYSYKLIKELKINSLTINIGETVNCLKTELSKNIKTTEQTNINLLPRIRMATVYAVSQSNNGRVANTSNLSERWVGYSTRYGDSVGDFAPLFNLTATETVEIGKYLGLSNMLTDKVPSDGLSGKTDEEKLGFLYKDLDVYIRQGVCDAKTKQLIDRLHNINKFKLFEMPSFYTEQLKSNLKD